MNLNFLSTFFLKYGYIFLLKWLYAFFSKYERFLLNRDVCLFAAVSLEVLSSATESFHCISVQGKTVDEIIFIMTCSDVIALRRQEGSVACPDHKVWSSDQAKMKQLVYIHEASQTFY